MADKKVSTPSSSTGIVRFYDVQSSKVQIDPRVVIVAVSAFIVLIVVLEAVL